MLQLELNKKRTTTEQVQHNSSASSTQLQSKLNTIIANMIAQTGILFPLQEKVQFLTNSYCNTL